MSSEIKRRLEVDADTDYRDRALRVRCLEYVHPDAHPSAVVERARLIQMAAHSLGFAQSFVEVEYYYNGLYTYGLLEGAGDVTYFDRRGLESECLDQHVRLHVMCKTSSLLSCTQLADVARFMALVQQHDFELRAIFGECFRTSMSMSIKLESS